MKYSIEDYENAEFYYGEEDVLNYKSKVVKTREIHKCVNCQKEVAKGSSIIMTRLFQEELVVGKQE